MNRIKRTRKATMTLLGVGIIVFVLVGQAVAQLCVQPPAGLVGWWPGDGNANDIQGDNHGTPHNGATFADGIVVQAFSFDGVDDFVQVPDSPNLRPTTITVDAWVFPQTFVFLGPGDSSNVFAAKDTCESLPGGCTAGLRSWNLQAHHGTFSSCLNKPGFSIFIGGSNFFVCGTATLPLKQWSHLAGTFDGNMVRLYLNGVLEGELPAVGSLNAAEGTPVTIGAYPFTDGRHFHLFNGLVDELEVFNRALSAAEVQAIFLAGSAGKCKTTSPAAVALTPVADVNPVSTSHTVTSTVTDAGGQPLSGIVVDFRVEGSVNVADSCLTNGDGQCDVTYAGPAFPGADSITAFADSNSDGQQNPDEPSDTATKAWVLPASTPGSVTGGGQIAAGAGHVAFGFEARNTTQGFRGRCNVVEPLLDVNIRCTDVTALVLSGTQATFFGNGTHNGAPVTYRIDVNDQGESGAGQDTFSITTNSGYVRSGTLTNGNIQVHN